MQMAHMNKQLAAWMTPHTSDCLRTSSASSRATLRIVLAASLLLSLTACPSQQPQSGTKQASSRDAISADDKLATCQTSQLAFSLDPDDGRFNGMSHSGTMLVLRNIGQAACTIPLQPMPTFTNASRQTLHVTAQDSFSPQRESAPPIMLAPGTTITSDMRWLSSNVYDHGRCETPAFITLTIDKQMVTGHFTGHLCGPGSKPPTYTLTPFQPGAARATATVSRTLVYTCADGRSVEASYPDTNSALLILDGHAQQLHTAISADGARYVGKHWQWWTKGMHDGQLAPLKPGETIASASGVSCTAR